MAKRNKAETKKARNLAKVQQLDKLGSNPNEFIKAEAFNAIEQAIGDFISRVVDNINNIPNFVNTGAIAEIQSQATPDGIEIIANKHLLYQERGVSGTVTKQPNTPHAYTNKRPPVDVFKQLIKSKNIQLENNEKYKGDGSPYKELTEEQKINKAAWGMATNVYKHGIKGKNIYSKELPKLIEDCSKLIEDFGVQSILQNISVKESAKRVIIK